MKILKSVIFTIVVAFALSVSSCYQPLTELLIAAIEDKYNPVIVLDIDSLKSGDIYYSTINITGDIQDDSLSSGDGKGLIRSISFTASSLKGRILIDSEGNDSPDTDFGTGVIDYSSSGHFEIIFEASEMGYAPYILNIPIVVIDFNGNESTQIIQLFRSTGPHFTLIEPSFTEYSAGDTVTIWGTVADSILRDDESGEIATLRLDIQALGISAELDLENGETTKTILSRGVDFTFNPANQEFFCSFVLLGADDLTTTFRIDLLATDKLGQSEPKNITMNQVPAAGPLLLWSLPTKTGKFYYSGNGGNGTASFLAYDNGSGGSPVTLNEIRNLGWVIARSWTRGIDTAQITLKSTNYTSPVQNIKTLAIIKILQDPLTNPYGQDQYLYDINIPGSWFSTNCNGKGSAFIVLEASDEATPSLTSSEIWTFTEDSDAPVVTLVDLSTTPSSNDIGDTHIVTFSFTVDDGPNSTGFDPDSLTVTIAGEDAGSVVPVNDVYEVVFDMQNASQSSGKLQIDVYAKDYIGNHYTTDLNVTNPIQYYEGSPTVNITDYNTEWGAKAYARTNENVTIYFDSTQPLGTDPVVTIGGASASVTDEGGGTSWSAEVNGCTQLEGPIEVTITGIENVVGTSGTFPSEDLAALYYPGLPELELIDISLEDSNRVAKTGDAAVGDFIVLIFDVLNDRVLDATPTVEFTYGPSDTSLQGSISPTYTNPGHYRFELEIEAADHLIENNVDYSVVFKDAAGNDGLTVTGSSTFDLYTP